MIPEDKQARWEELQAGRLLLDLSPAEEEELRRLSEELGEDDCEDLEWVAAALEASYHEGPVEALPADLEERLRAAIPPAAGPGRSRSFGPLRILRSPLTGWAVAAALALVMVLEGGPSAPPRLTPTQARDRLLASGGSVVTTRFDGLGGFAPLEGELVWSDEGQEGYMTLANLPKNDPSEEQYQLWIVDPERDPDAPVDGGVFDVRADGRVVVPIDAKLLVDHPVAFVITLEHPGGVVKSQQETVVGIAKAPAAE
jgi:anti-sigma-K factor RskA